MTSQEMVDGSFDWYCGICDLPYRDEQCTVPTDHIDRTRRHEVQMALCGPCGHPVVDVFDVVRDGFIYLHGRPLL